MCVFRSGLKCQPRLANPTWSHNRQNATVSVFEMLRYLSKFRWTLDEWRCRNGEANCCLICAANARRMFRLDLRIDAGRFRFGGDIQFFLEQAHTGLVL